MSPGASAGPAGVTGPGLRASCPEAPRPLLHGPRSHGASTVSWRAGLSTLCPCHGTRGVFKEGSRELPDRETCSGLGSSVCASGRGLSGTVRGADRLSSAVDTRGSAFERQVPLGSIKGFLRGRGAPRCGVLIVTTCRGPEPGAGWKVEPREPRGQGLRSADPGGPGALWLSTGREQALTPPDPWPGVCLSFPQFPSQPKPQVEWGGHARATKGRPLRPWAPEMQGTERTRWHGPAGTLMVPGRGAGPGHAALTHTPRTRVAGCQRMHVGGHCPAGSQNVLVSVRAWM